jgi:hypothetical protein
VGGAGWGLGTWWGGRLHGVGGLDRGYLMGRASIPASGKRRQQRSGGVREAGVPHSCSLSAARLLQPNSAAQCPSPLALLPAGE